MFIILSLSLSFFFFGGASLVAQLVNNLPVMQETPVQFLGWEDPLKKRTATHCSILAWGCKELLLSDFHFLFWYMFKEIHQKMFFIYFFWDFSLSLFLLFSNQLSTFH